MLQAPTRAGLRSLTAAILATGALAAANQAWANTAASTTVRNVVTVSYKNAAGTDQPALTDFVDVKVNLVAAVPTIRNVTVYTAPDTNSALTTDPNTPAVYTYQILNNSNGRVTYSLAATKTSDTTDGADSTVDASTPAIELGATVIVTGVASTPTTVGSTFTIEVPRDDVAGSGVNGIDVGDTVEIGGRAFTVAAVNDQQVAAAPGASPTLADYTTTITLNSDGTDVPIPAGAQVGERATFTSTVTPGEVTSAGDKTIGGQIVVSDSNPVTATAIAATADDTLTTTTTVAGVGLSVQKLVRNISPGAAAGSAGETHCGVTAYASGVTANPGETLEYLVVVTKNASASAATGVIVSDPIPPFTTLVANSMQVDADGEGSGTSFVAVTDSADGDAGRTNGSTVYFYPGTGGTDAGTGGTLAASAKVCMTFQVTVQ